MPSGFLAAGEVSPCGGVGVELGCARPGVPNRSFRAMGAAAALSCRLPGALLPPAAIQAGPYMRLLHRIDQQVCLSSVFGRFPSKVGILLCAAPPFSPHTVSGNVPGDIRGNVRRKRGFALVVYGPGSNVFAKVHPGVLFRCSQAGR